MSRLMDIGVIQMPFDMVVADEVSMLQFYNRANAILNELLELEAAQYRHAAEREALVSEIRTLCESDYSVCHDPLGQESLNAFMGKLLALLISDTQDVLENSGSQG
jgi:hypothetical protein